MFLFLFSGAGRRISLLIFHDSLQLRELFFLMDRQRERKVAYYTSEERDSGDGRRLEVARRRKRNKVNEG